MKHLPVLLRAGARLEQRARPPGVDGEAAGALEVPVREPERRVGVAVLGRAGDELDPAGHVARHELALHVGEPEVGRGVRVAELRAAAVVLEGDLAVLRDPLAVPSEDPEVRRRGRVARLCGALEPGTPGLVVLG